MPSTIFHSLLFEVIWEADVHASIVQNLVFEKNLI